MHCIAFDDAICYHLALQFIEEFSMGFYSIFLYCCYRRLLTFGFLFFFFVLFLLNFENDADENCMWIVCICLFVSAHVVCIVCGVRFLYVFCVFKLKSMNWNGGRFCLSCGNIVLFDDLSCSWETIWLIFDVVLEQEIQFVSYKSGSLYWSIVLPCSQSNKQETFCYGYRLRSRLFVMYSCRF